MRKGNAEMTTYKTCDLQLASYLATVGYPVRSIEGQPSRREFVFAEVPAIAVAEFFGGGGAVAPRELFRTYRELKARVFEPR